MQIPIEQRVIAVLFSFILLAITFQLIRKHKLREEYALAWLAASLAIFLFTIFGGLVNFLARVMAVTYAPTLILVFGLLFCLVMLLSQTVMLSTQANRIRDLAQYVGILEHRLRQVEKNPPDLAKSPPLINGLGQYRDEEPPEPEFHPHHSKQVATHDA